jgi:sensor histidine kinase YesM
MTNLLKTGLRTVSMRSHLTFRHVLLDLLYTVITSILVAGFLSIVDIAKPFLVSLVMSLSIGVSICFIIILLLWLFNPRREKALPMVLIMFIGIVGGMIIGFQIGPFLLRYFFAIIIDVPRWGSSLKNMTLSFVIGGTTTYFFYSRAKLRTIRETAEEERINRLSSEKEALEAKLRLLQAQIEPHFLFNTLSNVLSLIDSEPAKGKFMLMDLIRYLRTSLSRTLHETTTLEQEIDMIKAYLNIQKIRMDERLDFTIELPDALRQHPFPPMLLQPLVENAIKHGLEPKINGGTITTKVMKKDSLIKIEVIDTGIGLSSYQKTGVGIGNVKERLQLLYGEKGRLTLEENKPSGVRAIIEVPEHDL